MSDLSSLSLNTQSYLAAYGGILARMASRMEEAEPDLSVSGSLIRQMLPHQEAAVRMSENLLRYTTNLRLERVAQSIILEGTRSMEDLRRVRRACSSLRSTPRSAARYASGAGGILEEMLAAMESARRCNSIDLDFVSALLPHQEGGLRMARLALGFPLCPALVPILQDILASHSRALRALREAGEDLGTG